MADARLTNTEHYLAAAGYLLGGGSSTLALLWLFLELSNAVNVPHNARKLHRSLALANLSVVCLFFMGALSHYNQRWALGNLWCTVYTFMSKFGAISAVGNLAACLWGEYDRSVHPKKDRKDVSYDIQLLLAWANGLFWGLAAVNGWAEVGYEPAGYTCTVIWYKSAPFTTYMTLFGFGVPLCISGVLALLLWKNHKTRFDPFTAAAAALVLTTTFQYAGYAGGYAWVILTGRSVPLGVLAAIPVFTKTTAILHPLVYKRCIAVYKHHSIEKGND